MNTFGAIFVTEEWICDDGMPAGWFERMVASEIDIGVRKMNSLFGFPIVESNDAPKLKPGDIEIQNPEGPPIVMADDPVIRPTTPAKFSEPPLNMAEGLHGDSDADTFRTRTSER